VRRISINVKTSRFCNKALLHSTNRLIALSSDTHTAEPTEVTLYIKGNDHFQKLDVPTSHLPPLDVPSPPRPTSHSSPSQGSSRTMIVPATLLQSHLLIVNATLYTPGRTKRLVTSGTIGIHPL
jgi:hypothetical protein